MNTLLDILRRTEAFFRDKDIPSARLDAELIMAHVLGLDRVMLYVQFERPLTDEDLDALRPLVARRGRREPVAYLVGSKGFHSVELVVSPGVLVPRPDTETLVDAALALIPEEGERFVADVGCGTGAVGLAIAALRSDVKVYATDLSPEALYCTKTNVDRLHLEAALPRRGSCIDKKMPWAMVRSRVAWGLRAWATVTGGSRWRWDGGVT